MADNLIIQKAVEEIESKSLAVTEQFLEIHEVVYDNGMPKIARIDKDKEDGVAVVYFPVKDEKFYFSVYINTRPDISIRWTGTEPHNSISFRAYSDTLSLEELAQLSTLKHTGGRNKGDPKRTQDRTGILWKESTIFYEPNSEPDEFEDKLRKLLDFLERDKEGIAKLIDQANGCIQVAIEFHNGNTMLGGPHIDKNSLKRMANLNLEIDFDLYVSGRPFN